VQRVTVSAPTAVADVERKRRHMSAGEESHSDSESTSLQSRDHDELSSTNETLPRPRSSVSLIELIDSSSHAFAGVEQLASDSTSVCTEHCAV